jgi:hypothetical protein
MMFVMETMICTVALHRDTKGDFKLCSESLDALAYVLTATVTKNQLTRQDDDGDTYYDIQLTRLSGAVLEGTGSIDGKYHGAWYSVPVNENIARETFGWILGEVYLTRNVRALA